jgi:hypothetical protein
MKVYAQFYYMDTTKWTAKGYIKVEPFEQEILGTDGVFILDGRNSIDTMIQDAKTRADKLKNVKTIHGFKIIRANKFSDTGTILCDIKYNNQ